MGSSVAYKMQRESALKIANGVVYTLVSGPILEAKHRLAPRYGGSFAGSVVMGRQILWVFDEAANGS